MHSTHQFFLTERSLYVLDLNGRQGHEDADAEYWLELIQSFGNDSPVIVVLNTMKEHPFDVNHRALREKFKNIQARRTRSRPCPSPRSAPEEFRTSKLNSALARSLHSRQGENWAPEIDNNLKQADIILRLGSADFIASEDCYDLEMKQAMDHHKQRKATVSPIAIRPAD